MNAVLIRSKDIKKLKNRLSKNKIQKKDYDIIYKQLELQIKNYINEKINFYQYANDRINS